MFNVTLKYFTTFNKTQCASWVGYITRDFWHFIPIFYYSSMNKPFQTFFRVCVCGWVRVEPPYLHGCYIPTFWGVTEEGGALRKSFNNKRRVSGKSMVILKRRKEGGF